jgi:hypothetical protein
MSNILSIYELFGLNIQLFLCMSSCLCEKCFFFLSELCERLLSFEQYMDGKIGGDFSFEISCSETVRYNGSDIVF